MASYTLQDVADHMGQSYPTAQRHVKLLEKKRKFKKTSVGKFFNDRDMKKLARLLGFDLKTNGHESRNGKSHT